MNDNGKRPSGGGNSANGGRPTARPAPRSTSQSAQPQRPTSQRQTPQAQRPTTPPRTQTAGARPSPQTKKVQTSRPAQSQTRNVTAHRADKTSTQTSAHVGQARAVQPHTAANTHTAAQPHTSANTHTTANTHTAAQPHAAANAQKPAPAQTVHNTPSSQSAKTNKQPAQPTKAAKPPENKRKKSGKKKGGGNKRNVIIVCVILAVVIAAGIIIGWALYSKQNKGPALDPAAQKLDYTETLDAVNNPDQGFYRPSFVSMKPDGVTASKPIYDDFTLYHLRVDVSAFSGVENGVGDLELTQAALDGLDEVMAFYAERERSMIVRLAYDKGFGGAKNKEPSMDIMLSHIAAVSTVLNKYTDALTAVEVGMIGPWGEMHSSDILKDIPDVITRLADAYLDAVVGAPILVRKPQMIYDYLGITVKDIDGYVERDGKSKRLGLFNDGYLGSENDLGTFTDREREVKFLGKREGLPYGGEVTVPGSKFHDINNCVPEMFAMNLSYLNYEWNNTVVQSEWTKSKYTKKSGDEKLYYGQSAFTYIRNRMGYRLVLRQSILMLKSDGKLSVSLDIENVGFGGFNRKKQAAIILVGEGGRAEINIADYSGGSVKTEVAIPDTLASGKYKVYIKFHSGDKFRIRLANNDIYDETLGANYVGEVEIAENF